MDISVLVGATCAVIRIKICAWVGSYETKWKFYYKKASESTYTQTDELACYHNDVYGKGPMFYDLTGLEPETTYNLKLVITNGDPSLPAQTSEKTFTTEPIGDFEFKDSGFSDYSGSMTLDAFNNFLDWFKNCYKSVGYDYKITEARALSPYNDGTYFSAKIYVDESKVNSYGAGALSYGYKGTIYLKTFGSTWDKGALIHEYRHYLGLSSGTSGDICNYHGDDPSGAGFDRASHSEYCSNISKVVGFARGIDSDDMEIYMFYGENSVDSMYIPQGDNLLSFFLLKALGLNDVEIVY